jgi:hypothetical protein
MTGALITNLRNKHHFHEDVNPFREKRTGSAKKKRPCGRF